MGMGLYYDTLYFDARAPGPSGRTDDVVTFVDAGGASGAQSDSVRLSSSSTDEPGGAAAMSGEAYNTHVRRRVAAIPRLIEPFNYARVCAEPVPRRQSVDYVWQDPDAWVGPRLVGCSDDATESAHCSATSSLRLQYAADIWKLLKEKGVEVDPVSAAVTKQSLDACITLCNTCDSGATMQSKRQACDEFIHWAPLNFVDSRDSSNFYVLDNSQMASVACQDGHYCIKSSPVFGAVYVSWVVPSHANATAALCHAADVMDRHFRMPLSCD